MNRHTYGKQILAGLIVATFGSNFAGAQQSQTDSATEKKMERSDQDRSQNTSGGGERDRSADRKKSSEEHQGSSKRHEAAANKHVNDAVQVVARMESTPDMKAVFQEARGVFIVPTYGRGAVGVGGEGGSGVLMVKHEDGNWSDPVFYNIAGLDIGLQAGGEAGPMALILTNQKAIDRFMQNNHFSLTADSGITVVDWSKRAEVSVGSSDVIAWAQEQGLFGNAASVGIEDIRFNRSLTRAYYDRDASPKDIVAAQGKNPQATPLRQALAHAAPQNTATGSSGSEPDKSGTKSGEESSTKGK